MNPHIYLTDEQQIKSVESLKRVDQKGMLYEMDCTWDYYNLSSEFETLLNPGCSTFFTKNHEGEHIFCRNYDYRHYKDNKRSNPMTALEVICRMNNPKAKYRSIGVADAIWLDFKNGSIYEGVVEDGVTDLSAFALTPYVCMDGMNEMGLAVSVMALVVNPDWNEIDYDTYKEKLDPEKENFELTVAGELPDNENLKAEIGSITYNTIDKKAWVCSKKMIRTNEPGKKSVLHPVLMRMMLDYCANVDEAVGLAHQYNIMNPMPGTDNHILVSDKSGTSKIIEWIDGKLVTMDINHSTNYRLTADDIFHGECPRDEMIVAGLKRTETAGMSEEYTTKLMSLIAQYPEEGNDKSKTLHSCLYNLDRLTVKVFSVGDFTKAYEYKL